VSLEALSIKDEAPKVEVHSVEMMTDTPPETTLLNSHLERGITFAEQP
jgi:hypothetical protein